MSATGRVGRVAMSATGRVDGSGMIPSGAAIGAEPVSSGGTADAATRAADPAAFEAAVGPLWSSLVRRLVLLLGDRAAAEDVAQDAFLRAFRSWDRFDGSDARAWLYTIALRLAFNEQRRHRRWLAAIRRIEPRPWPGPSDPDLWAALSRLDMRTRAALLLNAVDGYSQREIAAMLGVAEGTVASWLSRGRTVLRADLGDGRDR
jgi:RNA polymerase sigma-70 factor, ECF subfamily